ncbi:MAG: glutamyl-tRNA reductase [PVC group bacterium]|nr:glutamyl-tRNA reductase [PVC group bacterium]
MMNIELIGISHKTAPIEIRERLSFSNGSLEKALCLLIQNSGIKEGVILSTCNRVEIYAFGDNGCSLSSCLTDFLSMFHDINKDDFQNHLYSLRGLSAIRHLFRVSSSLDSQVLGENQILGQIKTAYFKAKDVMALSSQGAFLFEEAIKLGKRVRSQTQIGYGAVSISTAAVEMTKKIFEDLSQKKVLIIGAGKIGELSVRHLYDRGVEVVLVANRTKARAQDLANKFNGKAVDFSKVTEVLKEADIVICSVSSPHLLVTKSQVVEIMGQRKQRPVFFIDLGLPRNIDPQINDLDNVYVYNLDDLKKVKDVNLRERLKEAEKIESIIDECLHKISGRVNNA